MLVHGQTCTYQPARSTIPNGTARTGQYVLVRQQIGTWTARYREVPSIGAISTPLPPKTEEEEEGEEKGEPGDPTPLSLDDLDPSLPSLARPRRREDVASDEKREATLPRAAS
ncbi:hypothetical protein BHM03_00045645 [Ensete ventricosum]|nr:hypothetical protein BHM03_00045645 [Ensete ventricosum]